MLLAEESLHWTAAEEVAPADFTSVHHRSWESQQLTETRCSALRFHFYSLFPSQFCGVWRLQWCSWKERAVIWFLKRHSSSHMMWLQLSFSPPRPPGCRSLVSEKCNVAPKSRGGLCARRLPLRGVSCPGHSPAARLRSLAAENGLTGAAGHQLGYRVTHTQFHISPPMSYSI